MGAWADLACAAIVVSSIGDDAMCKPPMAKIERILHRIDSIERFCITYRWHPTFVVAI